MSAQPNPSPWTITTCKHCQKRFEIPLSLNVPAIGQQVDAKAMKVVEAFMKHLQKEHPDQIARSMAAGQDMMALSVLLNFEHENQSVTRWMEQARSAFFRVNQKRTIPDAMLEDRIARLALNQQDAAKVLDLCRQLRDFLTEANPA